MFSRSPVRAAKLLVPAAAVVAFVSGATAGADERLIDIDRSTITLRVTTGDLPGTATRVLLPLSEGSLGDLAAPHLQMVFEPRRLRILDTGLSQQHREGLHDVLLGPDVLDVSRFSRITFHSLSMERRPSGWIVHGELELRGRFYAVPVHVDEDRGGYRGSFTLRLSDYGIPVNRSSGTFALHDEVVIEFVVTVMP